MKIAIVYDVVYPYRLGGGERRNWEIAKRLAACGHEVWLVSVQMWEGGPEIVREGVHYVGVCPWKPGLFKKGKRAFFEPLYFARHLFSCLRRREFDIIDCSNFPYLSCLSAWLATRFRRARLVITWYEVRGLKRWIEHRGGVGILAWIFELIISRLTELNVVISALTEQRAREVLGLKNTAIVPCGVDYSAIGRTNSVARQDQILYVGRLARYKRVDMLIEAFHELTEVFSQYTLRIVGTGAGEDSLQSLVKKLGLQQRVIIAGSLSDEELWREYLQSRVFVLPSEQEGFGIVLVEAMAAGTPVVALAARDSAARVLITDERDGLLVRTKSEMVSALKRLLSDEALWNRVSEGARQTARNYDWDTAVVPILEEYYQSSVAG